MIADEKVVYEYQYCFLLSGPEPQRTLLEDHILTILPQLCGSIIIVRGLPGNLSSLAVPKNVKVFNHLSTNQLASVLSSSDLIICRSGYTSVMELIGLQKKALLIPTPGQTEQEYLAQKLLRDQRFFTVKQEGLNLLQAIESAENFPVAYSNILVFSTNTLESFLM
jgi:UDP-N-acetylglucosamine:LPS N-acetylglucosamine transferase